MTDAAHFKAWLDRFFDVFYRDHPVTATFIGRHIHDSELPGDPVAALDDVRSLRDTLDELPEETLEAAWSLDRKLARGFLAIEQWELEAKRCLGNPAWYTGEAIFGAFSLLLRDFTPMEERLQNLRARLGGVPAFLERASTEVRASPKSWVERAMNECDGALAFLESGWEYVDHASELDEDAAQAAEAFRAYRAHLESLPESNNVACGEEAYARLLREGHHLDANAEDILEVATNELARCEKALSAEGDWRAKLDGLADIHPPRARYYKRFRELWEQSRALAEHRKLVTWPDYPVDYVPRPAWARDAAPHLYFLFYRSPAPFDRAPSVDYFLTPLAAELSDDSAEAILRATNDCVIKLNHVVHHGGIGHHIQNWHAQRAASRIGQMAAVDGASRIAMLSGGTMAEGWACYATDRMDEAGFLTPLESFSQHHAHLRMAARAVVDIRLHRGEMSFEQAERFYVDTTNMSPGAARGEVTKNGMFPAAALMYLVGANTIHALRRELTEILGSRFDLRTFHDRFLSYGSIPVSLIRETMLSDPAGE